MNALIIPPRLPAKDLANPLPEKGRDFLAQASKLATRRIAGPHRRL